MPKTQTDTHAHKIFCLFYFVLFFLSLENKRWTANFFCLAYHYYLYQRKKKRIEYTILNGHDVQSKKCIRFLFFPFEYRSILMPIEYKTCKTTFQFFFFFCTEQAKSSVTVTVRVKLCSAHNTNRSRMNERMRDSWS